MDSHKKKQGNILFITILSSLILTASLAMGAIGSYSLFRAREEISSNQMRLTAKSALSQTLYRIDKKIYDFSNKCEFDQILKNSYKEKIYLMDWVNIVLDSQDGKFYFPKSFLENTESLPNSLGGVEIDIYFDGESQGRSINNLNGETVEKISSRYNIPPYSLDLMINVKSKKRVKRFEAVLSKYWPFALCSINAPMLIEAPAKIDGDICCFYEGYKENNGSHIASVNIRNSFDNVNVQTATISGDIYTTEPSPNQVKQGQTNGKYFGEITPFFPINILSSFLSLVTDAEGGECFYLNETLMLKDIFINDEEELETVRNRVNKNLLYFNNGNKNEEEDSDEQKSFVLRESLVLEGNNVFASSGDNVTASGHSNYIIKGSVISCAQEKEDEETRSTYIFAPTEKKKMLDELPGIQLLNCTLTIDGDLVLYGLYVKNKFGRIDRSFIPRIIGNDSALIVTGNIYMESAEIESRGEQFVIYSDKSIIMRPIRTYFKSEFDSKFRGAIVCQGDLMVVPVNVLPNGGIPKIDELISISGAIVAGGKVIVADKNVDNKVETNEIYNELEQEILSGRIGQQQSVVAINGKYVKAGLAVRNITVNYDPSTIGLLHKLIGYPKLSIWREHNN